MAGRRKRTRPNHAIEGDPKRQKIAGDSSTKDAVVKQAVLAQFYPQVLSLRDYLLSKLPANSKIRRKKIVLVGKKPDAGDADWKLSAFLDATLVGVSKCKELPLEERWKQWTTFSQKPEDSTVSADRSGLGVYSQSEIIDFAIWLLFSKHQGSYFGNQHLLCQGFRKDVSRYQMDRNENAGSAIPGIISIYPNSHVTSMKAWPWPQVLSLMGKEGERTMIDLIVDCGVFIAVENGCGTYHQMSGQPLGDLQIVQDMILKPKVKSNVKTILRTPSSISFVRNRILYARAAFNAKGGVRFGLRHIHVLNRYPLQITNSSLDNAEDPLLIPDRSTIHVMMYMFPRQFNLHNVFTSHVDSKQTIQPFKDYTLREDEITKKYLVSAKDPIEPKIPKIPKRLRGKLVQLVQKLQIRHRRCPYKKLLEYYCPTSQPARLAVPEPPQTQESSTKLQTQSSINMYKPVSITASTAEAASRKPSMMGNATSTAMVSAFCRAVLSNLIVADFWDSGDVKSHNERVFHQNVDRFIGLRRFESLSLHEVSQGLKIADISWLDPPTLAGKKLSQSDINKRWEIFHEFLYYIFDSLLIPLIRANFHVTESNVHGSRLFYFRQDVWRSLAEPALTSLKLTMFEEVKLERARKLLKSRSLGFSQVRLIPKATGVRPIMNLRRRTVKDGSKNILGSSINAILAPVHNILTFEKNIHPSRLGSTLFSVGELYTRLKLFKSTLMDSCKPTYFAKLDVQSAYDTIPQSSVLALIASLPSESEYRISKHGEFKPGENYRSDPTSKPMRKFIARAFAPDDFNSFEENIETDLALGKKNSIFIENIVPQFKDKEEILDLLEEHVRRNIVKIGKKFYRQKEGIAQGSVVSSLLCNYFYADLEARHLSFLDPAESLLLRLTDDFLLITTNRTHAKLFLDIMHAGLPAYGVRVNPDKTLVNFEATVQGKKLSRLVGESGFPYCGSFIDTTTLNISKDRERKKDMAIGDSLTVEFSRVPGKTFQRKALNSFKIQAHAMFLDTSFNSVNTVLSNIYSAFLETALKTYTYARCLPSNKQPGTQLFVRTITDLIELAFVLMKSKSKKRGSEGYKCAVRKAQVEFLAMNAFRDVLGKRQSKYRAVIGWLGLRLEMLRGKEKMCERMKGVIGTRPVAD